MYHKQNILASNFVEWFPCYMLHLSLFIQILTFKLFLILFALIALFIRFYEEFWL